MAIIEVKNLSKDFKVKIKEKGLKGSLKAFIKPKYKIIKAVKNISFEVEEGEMIAFIGPNGAGKSTTIKMMTGILYPGEGKIRVYMWVEGQDVDCENSASGATINFDLQFTTNNG